MAIPLLGLLAVQGARTIATRIAGSAATRRKVANILAKNFKKAHKFRHSPMIDYKSIEKMIKNII